MGGKRCPVNPSNFQSLQSLIVGEVDATVRHQVLQIVPGIAEVELLFQTTPVVKMVHFLDLLNKVFL